MMHKQGVLNSGRRIAYASGLTVGQFNGTPAVTHTGSTALSMLVASMLLILVGGAALFATRRRYHHRH